MVLFRNKLVGTVEVACKLYDQTYNKCSYDKKCLVISITQMRLITDSAVLLSTL